MNKLTLIYLLSIISICTYSNDYNYKFRLMLRDKGKSQYSVEKPQEFLSQKAIERRQKQNIAINESDLPISNYYLEAIEKLGCIIVAKSKWMETVSVHCNDSSLIENLKALPFVIDADFVWKGKEKSSKNVTDTILYYPTKETISFGNYYGRAIDNIKINNGQYLHNAGFKGKGMNIAVIDAGYHNLPKIELLDNINMKGYKGFVYGNEDLFQAQSQHGLNVVSCMATNKPMQYVGSAPEANYWLLGSEDSRSEYPIEEDYWAAAIEYADSIGIDIVNTSLGYNNFNPPALSYNHKDLDGKTAYITCAANIATNKGIFIAVSAGNSGDSEWRKITPPSDAFDVLTIGAVKRDSVVTKFSSRGFTSDMRIKPDAMALGSKTLVIDELGNVTFKSGTSFSSPILCGLVACLWQANPTLTNKELLQVIREASDRYEMPTEEYGYGIPNMEKAMALAQKLSKNKELIKSKK